MAAPTPVNPEVVSAVITDDGEAAAAEEVEVVPSQIQVEEIKEKEIHAKLVFTAEQKSDLLLAFNYLDKIGDGKIKADEFRIAIKALGYAPSNEELMELVSNVDTGTGKLSYENFETAIMRKVMAQDSDTDIMKSFRLFDTNDTGYVDNDDLKKVTEILGTYLTDQEIEEMIDDADHDLDGVVNVQEFMKMIKSSAEIHTP